MTHYPGTFLTLESKMQNKKSADSSSNGVSRENAPGSNSYVPPFPDDFESDSDEEVGEVPDIRAIAESHARVIDEKVKTIAPEFKFRRSSDLEAFFIVFNVGLPDSEKASLMEKTREAIRDKGYTFFSKQEKAFFIHIPQEVRLRKMADMVAAKEAKQREKDAYARKLLVRVVMVILLLLVVLGVGLRFATPELFNHKTSQSDKYQDYYEVLGVPHNAKLADIKTAFRQLSRELHPDRNPSCHTCTARYAVITMAYQCLSDEMCRSYYDINGSNLNDMPTAPPVRPTRIRV